MNLFPVFVAVAVIIASCESLAVTTGEGEDRIFGGKTAKSGQFPYQVSVRTPVLQPDNTFIFRHSCGGSIISNRWVLTATTCTKDGAGRPEYVKVVVGAHHIHGDGKTYALERVVDHPKYNRWYRHNDISLLRTKETIQFNDLVKAIPLSKDEVEKSVQSVISGWGRFNQSDEITYQKPEYLQFLDVKVITNRECILRQTETYRKFIYGGTICTHMKRGHGSCYEDEGNPLVYNGKQIGVSSWEISCARGKPEGFTRISEFLDWIQSESGVVAV